MLLTKMCVFWYNSCCRGDAVRHLDVFATFQTAMAALAAAAGGEAGLMALLQAGAGSSPSPAMQVGCPNMLCNGRLVITVNINIGCNAYQSGGGAGLMALLQVGAGSSPSPAMQSGALDSIIYCFPSIFMFLYLLAAAVGGEAGLVALLQAGAGSSPSPATQVRL
jgi:hypothetical protein